MNANTSIHRQTRSLPASPPRSRPRLFLIAALTGLLLLSGGAGAGDFKHRYLMQGQVPSLDGSTLVVCIGDRDGAEVGQELAVLRHVRKTGGPPKARGSGFRREPVGMARIVEVFDEHYARAQVLEGDVQVNDVVELAR